MADIPELPDGWEFHEGLVQEDLEKFEAEKDKADKDIPIEGASYSAIARNNRRWVTAAIRANWFTSCPYKVDDLIKQQPAELAHAAMAVGNLYMTSASPSEKKF